MLPAPFEIILSRAANKYYQRLPQNTARRIDRALLLIEKDPLRGGDIKPLKGNLKRYRLRIGDYRIIYYINFSDRSVFISEILPRGEAYKK